MTTTTTAKWEKVGECAVDSGTLIIVDPCYVDDDKPMTMDELVGPYSNPEQWNPTEREVVKDGWYRFVRLSNFGGDGVFPVYVQRDATGVVVAALISFTGEPDS